MVRRTQGGVTRLLKDLADRYRAHHSLSVGPELALLSESLVLSWGRLGDWVFADFQMELLVLCIGNIIIGDLETPISRIACTCDDLYGGGRLSGRIPAAVQHHRGILNGQNFFSLRATPSLIKRGSSRPLSIGVWILGRVATFSWYGQFVCSTNRVSDKQGRMRKSKGRSQQ